MNPGFVITAKGWELLANVLAGDKVLKITGVAFGSGQADDGRNIAAFTRLLEPVADGTSSEPIVVVDKDETTGVVSQSTISFVAEYRSDFKIEGRPASITGTYPRDYPNDFYIREFGIWAEDPVTCQNVMIYYATLGEMPHPVTSYSNQAIDIRRYPVSIVISADMQVELAYPALAFVTSEEMAEYVDWYHKNICEVDVDAKIKAHNEALDAHMNIRSHVISNDDRITALERLVAGGDAVQFRQDFSDSSTVQYNAGVYNMFRSRLEM